MDSSADNFTPENPHTKGWGREFQHYAKLKELHKNCNVVIPALLGATHFTETRTTKLTDFIMLAKLQRI